MHREGVTAAGAELVRLARSVGLVKGESIAIDGSKFQTVSSAKSVREREAACDYSAFGKRAGGYGSHHHEGRYRRMAGQSLQRLLRTLVYLFLVEGRWVLRKLPSAAVGNDGYLKILRQADNVLSEILAT
jgi:hypothetical protein